jgi:hypothetical protein
MDAHVHVWNAKRHVKSHIANQIRATSVNVASLLRNLNRAINARAHNIRVKPIHATPRLHNYVRARNASPFQLRNATNRDLARLWLIKKIIAQLNRLQNHHAVIIARSTSRVNPVVTHALNVDAHTDQWPNASVIRATVANAGGTTKARPIRTTIAITTIVVNR